MDQNSQYPPQYQAPSMLSSRSQEGQGRQEAQGNSQFKFENIDLDLSELSRGSQSSESLQLNLEEGG